MWFDALPPAVGNLHLLLLHLPVGFVVAAVLLEIWTWRDAAGRGLVTRLLAANAVGAVLTAAAGLVLAERGGYPEAALGWHRWAGVGCAVLAVLTWWLRARRGVAAGRVGLVLLAAATALAGHLGATLTHGDGLMAWTRPAPKVARVAKAAVPGETVERVAEPTGKVGLREDAVHPLLVENCVECHGEEKQKGRLRLDTLAGALAQGRSGEPGIVPGEPEVSEVLRRIALPRDDEEAMPPGDHDALTAAERKTLADWVAGMGRSR
jgi:mono/diheme cytochrome c family protein